MSKALQLLHKQITNCTACPRLIAHCREVAVVKRRAYLDQDYWGKPVPGFGDPLARVLILGLAPGAHGANRTGRMFTGDRSGDFLFSALHATGFANQPVCRHRNDGLQLIDAYLSNAGRCAPPGNKPSPEELSTCRPYLLREIEILKNIQVVVCLGRIALDAYLRARALGPVSKFKFGHGVWIEEQTPILCSYHPSQQNTQTGRLTLPMLESVFAKAASRLSPTAK